MKRYLSIMSAVAVALMIVLQGCGDEEVIENTPGDLRGCDIVIHVENENGENLLQPETQGYIAPEEVFVVYKRKKYEYRYKYEKDGKVYPFERNGHWDDPGYESFEGTDDIAPMRKTRAAIWTGLHDGYTMDWQPTINFGEFSATKNRGEGCHNETFQIVWPDGSSDEIVFDFYLENINGEREFVKNLYLNGVQVDAIVIVK